MAGVNPAVVAVFARALTTFSQQAAVVHSFRRSGAEPQVWLYQREQGQTAIQVAHRGTH